MLYTCDDVVTSNLTCLTSKSFDLTMQSRYYFLQRLANCIILVRAVQDVTDIATQQLHVVLRLEQKG